MGKYIKIIIALLALAVILTVKVRGNAVMDIVWSLIFCAVYIVLLIWGKVDMRKLYER